MSDPIANPMDTREALLTSKILQSAATLVKQLNSICKYLLQTNYVYFWLYFAATSTGSSPTSQLKVGRLFPSLDEAAIQKNSKEFLETVNKVQVLVQGEIVNLKD